MGHVGNMDELDVLIGMRFEVSRSKWDYEGLVEWREWENRGLGVQIEYT